MLLKLFKIFKIKKTGCLSVYLSVCTEGSRQPLNCYDSFLVLLVVLGMFMTILAEGTTTLPKDITPNKKAPHF